MFLQVALYGLAAAAVGGKALVVSALIVSKATAPGRSILAFTLGAAAFCALFASVELVLLAESDLRAGSNVGAFIDLAIGVLFVFLGVTAVFSRETPEREAARRAQAEQAASGAVGAMLVTGVVVQLLNIDALAVMAGGLKEIGEADITVAKTTTAAAVLISLMLVPYYGPGLVHLASPQRSVHVLGRLTDWLFSNSRMAEIVAGFLIGSIFTLKGLQELL